MLFSCFLQEVDRRQVFEIEVPSEARKRQIIKLESVWTRFFPGIPASTCIWWAFVSCLNFLLLINRRWPTKRRSWPLRSAQGEGKGVSNHYLN